MQSDEHEVLDAPVTGIMKSHIQTKKDIIRARMGSLAGGVNQLGF